MSEKDSTLTAGSTLNSQSLWGISWFDGSGFVSKKFTVDQFLSHTATQILKTGGLLYVDSEFGDNATAQRANIHWSFATIAAAISAANPGDTIVILPGNHATAGNLQPDGLTLHALDGAFIASTTSIFGGNGISYDVTGRGIWYCTNGKIIFAVGCSINFEAKLLKATSPTGGICFAEGGQINFQVEEYDSKYDGFALDTSTGNAVGGDYIRIRARRGHANHHAFYTYTNGVAPALIQAWVELHVVGWTGDGGGWGTFNVGGRIEFYGDMTREQGVADDSGSWHYAHGGAASGSSTRFSGRTLLICTDGSNPSEMRYGFRCDSNSDFTFELASGSYLHSHSYSDPSSTPIYWSNDVSGLLDLAGIVDQNGDAGSSTNCIRFMGATVWPQIEFRGCDLKQSGGVLADTVYLNAGATTYIGKLVFRDGPFPVTFTNSITGLEVDY